MVLTQFIHVDYEHTGSYVVRKILQGYMLPNGTRFQQELWDLENPFLDIYVQMFLETYRLGMKHV